MKNQAWIDRFALFALALILSAAGLIWYDSQFLRPARNTTGDVPPGRLFQVSGLVLCRPDSSGALNIPDIDNCVTIPYGTYLWVPSRPGERTDSRTAN